MRRPVAVKGVQQTGQVRVWSGMSVDSVLEGAGVGLVGAQPVGGAVDAHEGNADCLCLTLPTRCRRLVRACGGRGRLLAARVAVCVAGS